MATLTLRVVRDSPMGGLAGVVSMYSGTSLIRTAWDQHPFGLVKFSD